MWLYVFGSAVRGEIDPHSDVDVLAVVKEKSVAGQLPQTYLIYSREELFASFGRGDLFAHHLALESRLIYSSDASDLIQEIGRPAPYCRTLEDFLGFKLVALDSLVAIRTSWLNRVFELGLMYMAARDVAMILSYHQSGKPNFSKYAPYDVEPQLPLDRHKYEILKSCRAASTRGVPARDDIARVSVGDLKNIERWLDLVEGSLE